MSAVYKVMEQMQKTRPRRLRGNREVMIVLGCIVVVGMLMLVNTLNKRLKSDNAKLEKARQTELRVGAATDGGSADTLVIQVSLNQQEQWELADHGVVTDEELVEHLSEKRAEALERGLRSIVSAQISGDQPAKRFIELHRLAEQCGVDEIKIAANAQDLENWQQ